MCWLNFCGLLSITWIIIIQVQCQLIENTPPTMWLDRDLRIYDNELVGSKITQVHGNDAEGGQLVYGLENKQFYGSDHAMPERLPFRIDPNTGAVFLNESLKGRAGQNLNFYVTAFDGELTAKSEVNVMVLDPHNLITFPQQNRPPFSVSKTRFPNYAETLTKLPSHTRLSNISINPSVPKGTPHYASYTEHPPYHQQKTYPESNYTPNINMSTQLKPIFIKKSEVGVMPKSDINTNSSKTSITAKTLENTSESSRDVMLLDSPKKSQSDFSATVISLISVCAIFLTAGVFAVIFKQKLKLRNHKDPKDVMKKEASANILQFGDPGLNMQEWGGPRAFSNRYEPCQRDMNTTEAENQTSTLMKNMDHWEFPRHRLKFFNILGEGAFGQVWKCEAIDMKGKESGISVVAVKTLKENSNEKERSDLISELNVMKTLESHPNVVKLLGCCTDKEPIFLIMEYISNGKLQSYLRNSRAERYYNNMHGVSKSLTSRDLTSFVYQVAKGMEFLSNNGIIHRDLAARNILISGERTCKVADFGFARDVIASHIYERKSEGRLPIRWMAPESLYDNIYSIKSDVWSFGILIWEVVTLGSTPYPGMSAAEVMRKVRDGYRLDKPEHCRRELYNIMYYCWDKNTKERPSFTECVGLLEKLLMSETDYIELERFPDHSYYNMMSLSGEKL